MIILFASAMISPNFHIRAKGSAVSKQLIIPSNCVFVVLGMPRSGTSAVARGLAALGIYLGDQLIPAKQQWNSKGYFEDKDIVRQVNEKILNMVSDEWETVKILTQEQLSHPALNDIRDRAVQLIQQRFGNKQHWGFKDPRTARVLPFWQSIFNELKLEDHYVIVLRNPLASAHSFQKLTKIDLEKALLLWLAHLIPAIDETHNKKRIIVNYDLLLTNPVFQLDRIKKYFKIEFAEKSELAKYVNEFLDKKLQHYDFSDNDFQKHPSSTIIPVGLKVYDLLLRLAKDEIAFEDSEFVLAWTNIKNEFLTIYPIYSYIDTLLKRNKELERTLRTINKSLPWKMIYPLRLVDNKLRALRKKIREN